MNTLYKFKVAFISENISFRKKNISEIFYIYIYADLRKEYVLRHGNISSYIGKISWNEAEQKKQINISCMNLYVS